jgi:hypothetical protein
MDVGDGGCALTALAPDSRQRRALRHLARVSDLHGIMRKA